MTLENVVPWGRNLEEYREMFRLSDKDLQSNILGCGDGPSSFNAEVTKLRCNVISIDPIYQFTKDEIGQRIDETSSVVIKQLQEHEDDYVWKKIKSVDALVSIRLNAMRDFLEDYEDGKKENRYIHQELPRLSFDDESFDLVLSSHFLFLYSEHLDLQFHIDAILEMCRVARQEVRIFPIYDLYNQKSQHIEAVMERLLKQGFQAKIVKTDYEFQKGANEMLKIKKRLCDISKPSKL
ncbi:class I SAM-dependent methyltransferase [Sulfurimonas sp. HSL-1716]|uniref:class I SAM-dependent methyltransferase n=1 Tax=Hydrocurvibacter sulfurireducens TaxID=3131937 RepID=UPI0031F9F8BB